MSNKIKNRIPETSGIIRHDYRPDRFFYLAQKLTQSPTEPASLSLAKAQIKEILSADRNYTKWKHETWMDEKGNDAKATVCMAAELADYLIPLAKGDSQFAQPCIDLLNQIASFITEMTAETGPVKCSPTSQISLLFVDMLNIEIDFLRNYNTYPTLYAAYAKAREEAMAESSDTSEP